jgi:hypothetical protein
MTTQPWHVEPEEVGEQFVGFVLRNEAGDYYEKDGAAVVWPDEAKAEVDCALINAGVEL